MSPAPHPAKRRLLLLAAGLCGWRPLGAAEPRLRVLYEEAPPYSQPDAWGLPTGYAVELVRELLLRTGLEADWEFSSWPRIFQRGLSEAQVLMPTVVRLREREERFHWLVRIGTRRGYLFRLRSRPEVRPRTIEEVKAYRTAVIKDDAAERELLALGLELGRHLDRGSDYAAMLRKLHAGRNDLIALNLAEAQAVFQRYGHDPQQAEPVLQFAASGLYIALSLGSDEAQRQRLTQAWEAMRRDGSAAVIAARYPMVQPD